MAIKFHCEHCGKSITAPDDAGGRRGRCPACKEIVYVPAPGGEALDLAPLDEAEERRRRKLVEDNLRKEHDLLAAQGRSEKVEGEPPADDIHAEGGVVLPEIRAAGAGAAAGDPRDLVERYLTSMAFGQLAEANAVVTQLRANAKAARSAVDRFVNDPVRDSRLAQLPPPVVAGFLKQLQQQLK